MGVQVPANEVLFFPTLPLRVDAVKAKRGSTVAGRVMNVTNSRLAIDSSLSVADARLVRVGDPVVIEDQDLGVTAHGTRQRGSPGRPGRTGSTRAGSTSRSSRPRTCRRSSAPR